MIYITGDTHGVNDIDKLYNTKLRNLTKDDYVIILGDFGFIWNNTPDSHEKKWLSWLDKNPWTTLFIDGNHDNIPRLNSYDTEDWNGGKIHRISDSVFHLTRGQIFTLQGKKIFTMGGAQSIDKIYRIRNVSWWEEEVPNYKEQGEALDNLKKHNFQVDYVLSHTCPLSTCYTLVEKHVISNILVDPTNNFLEEVMKQTKFKHWFFGHYHADLELNNKFTVMYNKLKLLE